MAEVSKMVADRVAISRTVLSSIEVHGADVAADLEKMLFPNGAPKKLTVELFLKALHGALAASVEDLRAADLAHTQELSDDDAPREARDAAISELREKIIGVRGTLASVYGASILKAYGLSGETPTEPNLLLHSASSAASLLQSRPLIEKPKQEGVQVDPKALASSLAAAEERLKSALDDVRREKREAQLTQKRRTEALSQWNGRYQGVADTATGLYEISGHMDLAELVRPTARRRAGLTEEEDVAEGEPATPPEEAPTGEG
jgi:hypothetical protein